LTPGQQHRGKLERSPASPHQYPQLPALNWQWYFGRLRFRTRTRGNRGGGDPRGEYTPPPQGDPPTPWPARILFSTPSPQGGPSHPPEAAKLALGVGVSSPMTQIFGMYDPACGSDWKCQPSYIHAPLSSQGSRLYTRCEAELSQINFRQRI
jgi:hypothetical protein